ncbi:MAG: electron transport complex subunit G, partial [Gammaproteobacteria bacterium HGW-Gammaproteobacteria-7]
MSSLLRRILEGAGLLAAIGLLAAGTLSVVDLLTAERIANAERQAQLRALAVVLPPQRYDNDPITDSITVVAPFWLGSDQPMPVRRALLNGEPAALILDAIAPDGYSGDI